MRPSDMLAAQREGRRDKSPNFWVWQTLTWPPTNDSGGHLTGHQKSQCRHLIYLAEAAGSRNPSLQNVLDTDHPQMAQCLSNHQAQTAPAISDIQGLHPPNTELRCSTVLILKALLHLPLPSEPRLYIELPSSDSKTFPHSAFNLWFHFSQTAGTLEIRSSYWETDFRAEKKGMTLGCNKEEYIC